MERTTKGSRIKCCLGQTRCFHIGPIVVAFKTSIDFQPCWKCLEYQVGRGTCYVSDWYGSKKRCILIHHPITIHEHHCFEVLKLDLLYLKKLNHL